MHKRAYVRGIQASLIQADRAAFPDGDVAIKVADYIADHVNFDPGQVSREEDVKLARELLIASQELAKRNPGLKMASFTKLSSLDDLGQLAYIHASNLLEKAAEGSTLDPGNQTNAASTSAEGQEDAKQRPEGYAENSLGKTELSTDEGVVGVEKRVPNPPATEASGSNSLTEHSKTSAAFAAELQKLAEGSTLQPGGKGNKAFSTGEGTAKDQSKQDYVLDHQGAQGKIGPLFTGAAVVGKEVTPPMTPSSSPSGSSTNSLMAHTERAAAEKSAEDIAFSTLFQKVATEVLPYMPQELSDDEKIAHIRSMLGLKVAERARYVHELQKRAAVRTAGEVPPQFLEYMKPKGSDGDKDGKKDESKKDEKSEEKKEEEKKEAALFSERSRLLELARRAG